jgi:proto-oncogene serine/threonine-protein kinase mos
LNWLINMETNYEQLMQDFSYWSSNPIPKIEYEYTRRLFKENKRYRETINKPYLSKISLFSKKINLNNFKIGQLLGRGGFGTVNEAFIWNRRVALKIIHQTTDTKQREQIYKSFLAEKNINSLRHKNIITFLGCNDQHLSNNKNKIAFIIYEYGGKLNLNNILMNSQLVISPLRRKNFSIDLVNALEFIHDNNIVHMDLKPSNIIVTDNLVCKLTDFGCSIKLENLLNNDDIQSNSNTSGLQSPSGTIFYRAPELFCHSQSQVSTACDIYSLAICLWQLLTRDTPYHDDDPHVIIYQIVSQNLRPKYPELKFYPKKDQTYNNSFDKRMAFERIYRLIVERCWDTDASRRYTAKYIRY